MKEKLFHPATIISLVALFVALGGTSYAVSQLPKNSVGQGQLRSGSVSTLKLANGSVTSGKVKDGSLTMRDFASGTLLQGAQGENGSPGETGPEGERGIQGEQGAAGLSTGSEVVAFTVRGSVLYSKVAPGWSDPVITNPSVGRFQLDFGRDISACQQLGSLGLSDDTIGQGQIAVNKVVDSEPNKLFVSTGSRLGDNYNSPFVVSLVCPLN